MIGAGIAGLVAAHELRRYGHQVTVLETQSRTGGRAVTIRSFFPPELIAQAGPARFPGECSRVFEYSRKLGLKLDPFYPESGTVVGYFKGQRISQYTPSPEEFWGYVALVKRYPGGVERVSLRFALLLRAWARRALGRRTWTTFGIRGGTDLLTDALTRATDAEFRLNTTVKKVSQDSESVRVSYVSSTDTGTLEADYVVCAVPLSVGKRLGFSPPPAPEKVDLFESVPFSSAIRIFLQMSRAYWRETGHNGFAVTDTLGEIWDPHFQKRGSPALLVCYAQNELATRLGGLGETERLEYALEELEKIFPGAKEHFVQGISFCWDQQPWILGGWPLARHGFADKVGAFRKPDGRVYFAGDYVAAPAFLNTMEGAIESGEYVASQINRRVETSRT